MIKFKNQTNKSVFYLSLITAVLITAYVAYATITKSPNQSNQNNLEPTPTPQAQDEVVEDKDCRDYLLNAEISKIDFSNTKVGSISGSISYPGEGFPENLKFSVCAYDTSNNLRYCTDTYDSSKFKYGKGYDLELPFGEYYIYEIGASTTGNFLAIYTTRPYSNRPDIVKITDNSETSNIDIENDTSEVNCPELGI